MWGDGMLKAYIASVEMLKIDRHYDKSYVDMALEVIDAVLNGVGLTPSELDYIIVSTAFNSLLTHQVGSSYILAQYLGVKNVNVASVEAGEASGAAALDYAASLVKSGKASKVLVVGFEKMSEYPSWIVNREYSKILNYMVEGIKGVTPPDYAAIIMKEYMSKYNVTREDVFKWSVKMHENASKNPYAQLPFKISKDSYVKSLVMSDPITMHDSFPVGDGAAAALIVGDGFTSNAPKELVELVDVESSVNLPLYLREDLTVFEATAKSLSKLTSKHRVSITKDMALNVYDTYNIYGLITLESLGIAEKGKAHEVIDEMPYLNVGGGLKARGHPVGATPLYQLGELYKLMTEGFAGMKYDGEYSIIHSMSGPDNTSWLVLLRRCVR